MSRAATLQVFGGIRAVLGLLLLLAPNKLGQLWFGGQELSASTTALLRSVGARDIGLGVGLALNTSSESAWLAAGIVSDIGDAGAAVLTRGRLPRDKTVGTAISAIVYGAVGVFLAVKKS